jgi:DNA-binding LacI/PurR family transcriptional regulator
VIGFDDIPAAGYDTYQLSTIQQDTHGLANQAVDMLADRIDAYSGDSRTRVVPVTSVVRKTCG